MLGQVVVAEVVVFKTGRSSVEEYVGTSLESRVVDALESFPSFCVIDERELFSNVNPLNQALNHPNLTLNPDIA